MPDPLIARYHTAADWIRQAEIRLRLAEEQLRGTPEHQRVLEALELLYTLVQR